MSFDIVNPEITESVISELICFIIRAVCNIYVLAVMRITALYIKARSKDTIALSFKNCYDINIAIFLI